MYKSLEEDHPMEIRTVGIDLGKSVVHLIWARRARESGCQEAFLSHPTAHLYRQSTVMLDRHGSLLWVAFSGCRAGHAGPRGRGKLNASEFVIEPLSDPEIWRLLAFLEKHGALNTLEHLTPELRFAAIKKKHEKQLLVAMREATEDRSFDAIIEDEYVHIGNDKAKQVYLTVCCFYQHGALVRDGLLADLVQLSVTNMYKLTADATEGVVVYECNDPVRGTYVARARHRTIAAIVWERCGDIVQKEVLLQSALAVLNLNFKPDAEAFEQLIRADYLVDSIRTLEGRTRFFETAIKKDPDSPYVRQHYARMLTRSERPELALSQVEKALAGCGKTPFKRRYLGCTARSI
jgi:hypothetical protein